MNLRPGRTILCLAVLGIAGTACARHPDMVGTPLSEGQRDEVYRAVLTALPDTLRRRAPVYQPVVCLDRGIYAGPFGAHVEDHDPAWLNDMAHDGLIQAVADHSPATCPEASYWVTLATPTLLPDRAVTVLFAVQMVLRRTGPRTDRTAWRAVVQRDGGAWRVSW